MSKAAKIGKAFFVKNGVWYPLTANRSRLLRWSSNPNESSRIRGPKVCVKLRTSNKVKESDLIEKKSGSKE